MRFSPSLLERFLPGSLNTRAYTGDCATDHVSRERTRRGSRIDFPAGTKADAIEKAMADAGLAEFRVISNTNNDRLSVHYFIFGDKTGGETFDKFKQVFDTLGEQGTLRKGEIYSELIERADYEKTLKIYHGETAGANIHAKGKEAGRQHRVSEAKRKAEGRSGRSGVKPKSDKSLSLDSGTLEEKALSFKLPQNEKEFDAEIKKLADYVGMSPEMVMRQQYELEDYQENLEQNLPDGVGFLIGDLVAMNYDQVKEFYTTGKASDRDWYDVSFPRYEYLMEQTPVFWATGENLIKQIETLAGKNKNIMVIMSYPDLQGGMNTNPVYQEALRYAFYRSYGEKLVAGPMLKRAEEVLKVEQKKADDKIAKWQKEHPNEELTQMKKDNLSSNVPPSVYHAMTRVQPEFKDKLLPGQKRVSMIQTARDIADKDYYDKDKGIDYTGHVTGIAIFDKTVAPPASGEKDMRVAHHRYEKVNNYPVEVHGKSYLHLPKPIPIRDVVNLMNDYQVKKKLAAEKPLDVPVELREDWQLTKDEFFARRGFPPSSEAGNRARQNAMYEQHRLIKDALAKHKPVPVSVLASHRGYHFADKALGLLNMSNFWQSGKHMQAMMLDKQEGVTNPAIRMIIEAGRGDMTSYLDYLQAKDIKEFANKWNKNHGIKEIKFKLDRVREFTEDMMPEAGTPARYYELFKEAQENGWLTEEEWKDSNLLSWLENIPDSSLSRDYIVDYIEFRNSAYKAVAQKKSDPTNTMFRAIERQMAKYGLNVNITQRNLNNKDMQNFITRMAHLFNKNIHFVDVKGNFEFYGMQRGDDILISHKSKEPHLYVLGHELTHTLRADFPDLYNQLVESLQFHPTLRSRYMAKIADAYEKTPAGGNIDKLQEEIVGDLVGEFFMDKTFWKTLGDTNPTLLEKMVELLSKIVDQLRSYFSGDITASQALMNIEEARDAAAEIFSQYRNRLELYEQEQADAREMSFKLATDFREALHGAWNGPQPQRLFTSVNAGAQKRFNEANITGMTRWEKLQRTAEKTLHEFTRHFPLLSPRKDAVVTEALYQQEVSPSRSRRLAVRELTKITKGLDPAEYEVFRYAVILPDLIDYSEKHGAKLNGQYPFGYNNISEMKEDLKSINSLLRKHQKISDAVAERTKVINSLTDSLIKAGVLDEDKAYDNYFHHQVMAAMGMKSLGEKGWQDYEGADIDVSTPASIEKRTYGWQKARTGSWKDFNTNYVQAEFEVLAQGYHAVQSQRTLKKLERIASEYSSKTPDEIKRMIMDGEIKEWQPEKGNILYQARTISDKMLENVLKSLDDELTTKQEEKLYSRIAGMLETGKPNVLALGPKKPTWYLPTNIVNTLNQMSVPTETGMVAKASSRVLQLWKQWVLLNPLRATRYMLNNLTGDLDIVLAYDPKMLKGVRGTIKELWNYARGGDDAFLQKAERKGVINSNITAVEIEDLDKRGPLRALSGEGQGWLGKVMRSPATAGQTIKNISNFRENILRLHAYKYFQKRIMEPGGRNVYGASSKEAIDKLWENVNTLTGNDKIAAADDIAAKLARELIGDYGNISHAGKFIRRHMIPFYSWVEVNAPRYVRMMRNLQDEDQSAALAGARSLALKAPILTAKMAMFYGLVALWNATMFPDEDEEMKRHGRKQLHLILGRTSDGQVRSIRFQGAFSDALSWFGMEQPDKQVADIVSGKKDLYKALQETATAAPNKLLMGATPFAKTTIEALTGKSLFPDITRPKPIRDRTEHILRSLSLDLPYRYAKGIPTRGLATDAMSPLFAYSDPGEAAYYHSLQKMGEYLETVHKERPPAEPTERSNALYYYKQAIKSGNYDLANDWWEKYKKMGGTRKTMLMSIKKSDPLQFLPVSERTRYINTLDADDRQTLKEARDWWKRTYRGQRPTA